MLAAALLFSAMACGGSSSETPPPAPLRLATPPERPSAQPMPDAGAAAPDASAVEDEDSED